MLRDEVAAAAEEDVLEAALVEAADIEEEDDADALAEVVVEFEVFSSRPRASFTTRVPRLKASGSCL